MAQVVTAERSAPVEFRVSGRTLAGTAIRYGERARDRAEMFEAGAFQPLGAVTLNLQHDASKPIASTGDGTLRLDDTADELRIEADLRAGSAELTLVRRPRSAWSERRVPLPYRTPRERPADRRGCPATRHRPGRHQRLPDRCRTESSVRRRVANRVDQFR